MQGRFGPPPGAGTPAGPVPSEDCLYLNVWTAALSDSSVVTVFVATAPIAALYEEVVFRAYLLTRLAAWVGSASAVILSALCFAAIHRGYAPREQASAFFVGLLYGGGWLGTRSLLGLAGAHMIYNLLTLLA